MRKKSLFLDRVKDMRFKPEGMSLLKLHDLLALSLERLFAVERQVVLCLVCSERGWPAKMSLNGGKLHHFYAS